MMSVAFVENHWHRSSLMIRLSEFLRTGRLGALGLGTKRTDLLAFLGEPEARSEARKKLETWKYDSLQIALSNDSICLIALYFAEDPCRLPDAVALDGYKPTSSTEVSQFQNYLVSEQIESEIDPALTFDSQLCLRLNSGIHVYFGHGKLESLQLAGF
jgi:hypothetical protein